MELGELSTPGLWETLLVSWEPRLKQGNLRFTPLVTTTREVILKVTGFLTGDSLRMSVCLMSDT